MPMISTKATTGAVTITEILIGDPSTRLSASAVAAIEPPSRLVSRASANEPSAARPWCRWSGIPSSTNAAPQAAPIRAAEAEAGGGAVVGNALKTGHGR